MNTLEQTRPVEKTKPAGWQEPIEKVPDERTQEEINEENLAKSKADKEAARDKFKIIDDARYELVEDSFLYPFSKLEVGQGFFIPLEDDNTIDKLYTATNKQANQFRLQNSEVEKNDEGDEILENFTVRARLRNPDGSFVLDGQGEPKLSVSSGLRQKLIGPSFAVRAIVKDDEIAENTKAESNGVLVIRLG